ncbi:unnamed protein product [Paramecium primaurelia]|uniref:Transmembrane protein n=1 Tax=Paramecium primaurelia TaxID=5886 RepID=A0A8S1PNA4_PARPR|nr:unnamed protein product [Paramecium primaurelia]
MDPKARQSENQEKLISINRSQNIRLIKHTFQLFIIVEILVIITQIFMLSYYKLYTPYKQEANKLWVSFYYSCQGDNCFHNNNLCSNVSTSELYPMDHCLKSQDFNIFRYILSSILIIIVLIMIFDIYRMMKIKNELKNEILSPKLIYKAKKYQIFIILLLCLYYVILFIFIFGIDGYYGSGLGSAFFVGLSGFLIYLIIIIYFRYLKGRLSRETYFEKLLNGGLEASDLQQNFEFKTVECREERFYSVPDIDN